MKVVVHLDGATVRGNERQAALIARGLRARGHEVVVACRAGTGVERLMAAEGVATAGIRPRGDLDLLSAFRFALWLRRQSADALLLTSWKRAFTAGWAGRLAGVPRIVQRLGGPHPIRRGPRGWKQRVALTRFPHTIVFNSRELRAQLLEALPVLPPERTTVVYSGTAMEPGVPRGLRAELRLADGVPLILAVGGLEPLKGHEILIHALALTDPTARPHLAVAGGGGAERVETLRTHAERRGVADRVHFLGHREDVADLMAEADALVHASLIDSLPNAVLEAMRAGLPVVAADVDGVEDAVGARDGRPAAGWIVPRGDAERLARAIEEAVAGAGAHRGTASTAAADRAAEARWRAEHWFSVERMIDGYEAALSGGTREGARAA